MAVRRTNKLCESVSAWLRLAVGNPSDKTEKAPIWDRAERRIAAAVSDGGRGREGKVSHCGFMICCSRASLDE